MFPEQTFLFLYQGWRRIACSAAVVLLLSGGEAHAAWTVKRTVDAATGQARCYLESTPMTVSDGYQDIQASIVVRADAVLIHTASPLDTSFTDIGMQVDTQTFVPVNDSALKHGACACGAQCPRRLPSRSTATRSKATRLEGWCLVSDCRRAG